jgi:1-acyl-sn-glycerol-3-phosphate acyltransferase
VIRSALSWLAVACATVIFGSLAVLVSPFDRRGVAGELFTRLWASTIFLVSRVPVRTPPVQVSADAGPYIVMANHESHLDVALILWHFPIRVFFVAKKELFYIPIFGLAMWAIGHIPIDRGNREQALASLRKAGERIRAGKSVVIFPEGTRGPGAGAPMLEFKKGGFMLALASGVPILPVGIAGTSRALRKHSLCVHRVPVTYTVGEPIPTAGRNLSERDALMAEVRSAIETLRSRSEAHLRERTGV